MVWTFGTVNVPSEKSYVIFGGPAGKEGVYFPGAVFGTAATLAIPTLGYIQFVDQGNHVSGGDWSIKVSGTNSNWFYGGQGKMTINVDSSGNFTITGGQKDTSGKVTPWSL